MNWASQYGCQSTSFQNDRCSIQSLCWDQWFKPVCFLTQVYHTPCDIVLRHCQLSTASSSVNFVCVIFTVTRKIHWSQISKEIWQRITNNNFRNTTWNEVKIVWCVRELLFLWLDRAVIPIFSIYSADFVPVLPLNVVI